jgi:hypothetical protein
VSDYIRDYQGDREPFRSRAVDLAAKLRTAAAYNGGVGRWLSNGNAMPEDCAMFAEFLGLPVKIEQQRKAIAEEARASFDVYRAARANMTAEQRAEEAAERRAAFGPGVEVVDVLTGETFRT